ncbi:MAG: hypothetical protein ACYCZF_07685 [Anaerolineae bacterium]
MLEVVRDIAIILLALESIVIGIVLIVTLTRLRELLGVLRDEVTPLLKSLQDTAQTVRGTASIVGHAVVNPLIRVNSVSTGIARGLLRFFSFRRRPDASTAESVETEEQSGQGTS